MNYGYIRIRNQGVFALIHVNILTFEQIFSAFTLHPFYPNSDIVMDIVLTKGNWKQTFGGPTNEREKANLRSNLHAQKLSCDDT